MQQSALFESPKIDVRSLPIDMIITLNGRGGPCCLAVRAGLQYGVQSSEFKLCPYHAIMKNGAHAVRFVDNDYFNYDHARHLEVVSAIKPKYATTRDYIPEARCRSLGIAFHPLDEILAWGRELLSVAENVIIIPKDDIIDDIPEPFMLGFSVPSSHGGTHVPFKAFAGRRVHLLGGPWSDQLRYLQMHGDQIVSIDNNYLVMIARKGANFVWPDGRLGNLSDLGLTQVTNPLYCATSISFGHVGWMIRSMFASKYVAARIDTSAGDA